MTRLKKKAETKTEILSRWTQDNVEIFSQVCAKWENFNMLLSRHKQDINQHVSKFLFIEQFTHISKQHFCSSRWTV